MKFATSDIFDFQSSSYNNERNLMARRIAEAYNKFGVCSEFYITTYDTSYNKIFGEDGNRRFERNFNFMVWFPSQMENKIWTKDGIVGTDVFSMWCSKIHFKQASMVGNFEEYIPPKMGDVIRTIFNNYFYEITEVTESDAVYLQSKQFVWDFKVRPFKDELITTSQITGSSEIKNFTDKAKDIFNVSNTVEVKNEKIKYKPKATEKPQKNPWDTK